MISLAKLLIEDLLPGGKGDNLSPKDVDRNELKMGIKHEMEHTKNPKIAAEIALDHLSEDPHYYTHLKGAGIDEIKQLNPEELEKRGYIYYKQVDDWILWESSEVEEKDGWSAYGWVEGKGIRGKYYNASVEFHYEGSWEPDYSTVTDIDLV
jgi:hypothetical protein